MGVLMGPRCGEWHERRVAELFTMRARVREMGEEIM
jgi:hypothetical protein